MTIRIGQGLDVHAFYDNGQAVQSIKLGGISIPFSQSLKAHSDGDVVLHALTDALLGALALGDIGRHFPDTSAAFNNADSGKLLQKGYQLVQDLGYQLINADITIACELPKITPHSDKMCARIAELLTTNEANISIKATTTEQLGFTGRGEGILVSCVVLVGKRDER